MKQHMDANSIKTTIKIRGPEIRDKFRAEIIGIFGS